METPQKIAVIGGGSWATALVKILCNNCAQVHWWMRSEEAIAHIQQFGHNPKYLQSVAFDTQQLVLSSDLKSTLNAVDWVIIATPAAFLEEAFAGIGASEFANKVVFSAVKGIVPAYNAIPARFIHKSFGVPYDQIGPVLVAETKKKGDTTVVLRIPFDSKVQELVDLLEIGMVNQLKMIIATKEHS